MSPATKYSHGSCQRAQDFFLSLTFPFSTNQRTCGWLGVTGLWDNMPGGSLSVDWCPSVVLDLAKCVGFNPQKQPVTRAAFVWCTRPVIPVTQDQNELSSTNTVNQIPSFRIKALAKPLSYLLPWTKSGHCFGNADLFHGSPAKIFRESIHH